MWNCIKLSKTTQKPVQLGKSTQSCTEARKRKTASKNFKASATGQKQAKLHISTKNCVKAGETGNSMRKCTKACTTAQKYTELCKSTNDRAPRAYVDSKVPCYWPSL